jgi:hypothetical protein
VGGPPEASLRALISPLPSAGTPSVVPVDTNDRALLESIDAKLSGILVLTLDSYLRQTGVARPKERSIDRMLADVGLPTKTIAQLLGKTDRAVNLQLHGRPKGKKTGTRRKPKS